MAQGYNWPLDAMHRFALTNAVEPEATNSAPSHVTSLSAHMRKSILSSIDKTADAVLKGFSNVYESHKSQWDMLRDEKNSDCCLHLPTYHRDMELARNSSANALLSDLYIHIVNANIDPYNAVLLYMKGLDETLPHSYQSMFAVGTGVVAARLRRNMVALERKSVRDTLLAQGCSHEQVRVGMADVKVDAAAVQRALPSSKRTIEENFRSEYESIMQQFLFYQPGMTEHNGFIFKRRGGEEEAIPMFTFPVFVPQGTPANPDGLSAAGAFISTAWLNDAPIQKHLCSVYQNLFIAAGNDYANALKKFRY